jgi:hypothetical protein
MAVAKKDVYKIMSQVGKCMRCGVTADLRCGACFHCAPRIDGEPTLGGHRLWDRDNPTNFWFVNLEIH